MEERLAETPCPAGSLMRASNREEQGARRPIAAAVAGLRRVQRIVVAVAEMLRVEAATASATAAFPAAVHPAALAPSVEHRVAGAEVMLGPVAHEVLPVWEVPVAAVGVPGVAVVGEGGKRDL